MKKDVVYIDNDDEIASITDKVQNSSEKIVALVLPKRCTVLQSSVNMKILNKAANEAGKKVVLITSEAGLLPLAGAAGLFVAKTLQTKPAVPTAPQVDDSVEAVVESDDPAADGAEPELDETKSIGELDGDTAEEDEPIELGDEPATDDKDDKDKKEKKDKKLAVPNFDSFRVKLFGVIGAIVVLGVLWYVLFSVLPKATVVVKIQSKSVPVTVSATGSTTATTTDTQAGTVPMQTKTLDKVETKKFAATGEKNNGTKATGEVTLSILCSAISGANPTVPAGTGVSTGGLTFITQESVTLTSLAPGAPCRFVGTTDVISQNAGDQYNISSGRTFTVAGFPSITGTNSAGMGGGTTKNVKVVSASDCENAKNELLGANTDAYKAQLETDLKTAGQTPLPDTFNKASSTASCSPAVDQEATESTATANLKFTMSGVSTEGMNQLIDAQIQSQLKPSEVIYDNGLATGKFTIKEKKPNGDVAFEFTSTAQVGVKQDPQAIARSIAGKKYGDSVSTIKQFTGVTDVTITYTPFYVRTTPKDVNKITVTFESQNVSVSP